MSSAPRFGRRIFFASALCAGLMGAVRFAAAQASAPPPNLPPGKVGAAKITGAAIVRGGDGERALKIGGGVAAGESVVTPAGGAATLEFSNGAIFQLGEDSELQLESFVQAPFDPALKPALRKPEPSVSRTLARFVRGTLTCRIPPLQGAAGSAFTLHTPAGPVAIRGTVFTVALGPAADGGATFKLKVTEGGVVFAPKDRIRFVPAGEELDVTLPAGAR